MGTYSIKGRHETEGQWWNNEFGWVDHPQRDIFTETERHALNLPLGGEWMTEPTVDPEGEFAKLRADLERAEAEAARLRGLIMEHRAAVFIATPIATANHQLWREALARTIFDSEEEDTR